MLERAVQQSAGNVRLHAFTFASNHFRAFVAAFREVAARWMRGASRVTARCGKKEVTFTPGEQPDELGEATGR